MTDPVAIAEVIGEIKKLTHKPILPCFVGGVVMEEGVQVLKRHGLYNYDDPARAAYTMHMMAKYHKIRQSGLRRAPAVRRR